MDWGLFHNILVAHSIRAFIYHALSSQGIPIPENCLNRLKQHALQAGFNSLHQFKILTELLKELEQQGIRAIPYKGVCLASCYYDSISARESSDIDLLVAPEDVKRTRLFFHKKGYEPKADFPEGYLNYVLKHFKEITFKSPKDSLHINCTVEVQWKLLDRYFGEFANYHFFSPHTEVYQYNNQSYNRLKPAYDFLCVASNHLLKEPLFSFKYAIDLACIMQKENVAINSDEIMAPIQQLGAEDLFFAGLQTVEALLGIQAHPGQKAEYNKQLLENAIAFPPKQKEKQISFKSIEAYLAFDKSRLRKSRRKLRIFQYWLAPNIAEINDLKLPFALMPLLFIYRPFKLVWKFLRVQTALQRSS